MKANENDPTGSEQVSNFEHVIGPLACTNRQRRLMLSRLHHREALYLYGIMLHTRNELSIDEPVASRIANERC
jgi:hypothetical protein